MLLKFPAGIRRLAPFTARGFIKAGCAVGVLLTWSSSVFSDPTPAWLSWAPPPECPPASHIVDRVRGWLGGTLPEDGSLAVDTDLHWNGEQWEVSVQVSFDGHSGRREVAVSDCREAADFVSVAVVLAVDPQRARSLELSQGDGFDQPPTGSADESAPGASVPNGAVSAAQGNSSSAPDPAAAGGTPGETEVAATAALRPDVATPAEPGRRATRRQSVIAQRAPSQDRASGRRVSLRPHLTLALWGNWGALPGPRVGPGLAAGTDIGRWVVSGGVLWFPPANHEIEEANTGVDFSLLAGRVDVAYLFGRGRVRFGPLVAVHGGVIRAHQAARPEGPVNEPWFSASAGLGADVRVHPLLHVVGGIELNVPFTQPTFVLSDDTRVYRVGASASADLGLRVFFDRR